MRQPWATSAVKVRHCEHSRHGRSDTDEPRARTVGDYTLFLSSWNQPSGGIHGYLARFLNSGDPTFQHIAIWTLLQLLESGDQKLIDTMNKSADVMDVVRQISEKNVEAEGGEGDGAESEDGEGEVVALARRCLEISSGAGGDGQQSSASSVTAAER